jgi:hypothetical protein
MPTWHEFKNSVVVEMIFFNMEPFMNKHVQLLWWNIDHLSIVSATQINELLQDVVLLHII